MKVQRRNEYERCGLQVQASFAAGKKRVRVDLGHGYFFKSIIHYMHFTFILIQFGSRKSMYPSGEDTVIGRTTWLCRKLTMAS